MRVLTTLMLFATLSGPALAAPEDFSHAELRVAHQQVDGFDALEQLATDGSLPDARLDALSQDSDWRVRLNAGVVQALRADPGAARAVFADPFEVTRANLPRFMGAHFRQPLAAPVLMHRYFQTSDVGTRYAIAEMLPRTSGDWGQAVANSWQDEPDAWVRSVLVESIRHSDAELALSVLSDAARDDDAEVRAAAVRSIGWVDGGAQLEAVLVTAMSDDSADVRVNAARAAGWKGLDGAWDALRGLLSDDDAQVRLRALRALQRIDAERAAGLSELDALVSDADAKVARAAGQIAGR